MVTGIYISTNGFVEVSIDNVTHRVEGDAEVWVPWSSVEW